jgi:PhzF family phenazine biosynthesis protein
MNQKNVIDKQEIYRVNSFVAKGCQGNPAGVCLLPAGIADEFYRRTAVKLGASETAFILKKDGNLHLRWFTGGGAEVDLCGHATLASAYILWGKGFVDSKETIRFQTKSGLLTARKDGDLIVLDFPRETVTPVDAPADFKKILGAVPLFIGKTRFDYFLTVDSEATVKNITPDLARLKKLPARGFIVTAKSSHREYDFVSRFFAPAIGIDEDPVTGSAHCALGPYWSDILGKKELVGFQASNEGGVIRVNVLKDRVLLKGKARLVAHVE